MRAIKDYVRRYLGDLRAFAKAYALSTIGAFPAVAYAFGWYSWFALLFVAFMGVIIIGTVALLTAIFDSYLYKLCVYLAAVGYQAWGIWSSMPAQHLTQLIFVQPVLLFGLFYFLAERPRIWVRVARMLDGDDPGQRKMIAEEQATMDASRGVGR